MKYIGTRDLVIGAVVICLFLSLATMVCMTKRIERLEKALISLRGY